MNPVKKFFKLKDIDVKNKRVLVRVDFNVPLDSRGEITDDTRIKAALPTIKYLIKNNAMVILISHLGRPKGEIEEKLKMDNVAKRLEKLLKRKVYKLDDCVGEDIEEFVDRMVDREVVLLENLRFYEEEEKNDTDFAQSLADLADIYVNDAFGTCHRAHASVESVTRYLPSAAGFLVEKEIENLSKALEKPKKPFIAIIGGVKVSDKINLIKGLLKKVDCLLIGGAMMFTFCKSKGLETGRSIVEEDKLDLAKGMLKNKKIILPTDTIAADKIDKNARIKTVKVEKIPKGMIGIDIGPETTKNYKRLIAKAKTIVWNGPMGVFEIPKFAKGTNEIAKAISRNTKAVSIIGGGDSASAVAKLKLESRITHISTGGGASLEFLEGKKLPGIKALELNYKRFR
jgi:phosphoglycerate kinase